MEEAIKNTCNNVININKKAADTNNDDDLELPEWYEIDENGNTKFIEGLLTRHLVDTEKAFYCGGKFYFYENGVYSEKSNEETCKIIKSHCDDLYLKKSHITNVFEEWKFDIAIKTEDLNNDPYILNLKNGLLNLKTMELSEHNSNYKSTIQLNVNYRPELNIENATLFNGYLDKCIPDEETKLQAQEMLGYTYLGICPEKFFILTGETNTGKSTFLDIIEFIIGEKNKSNIPLQKLDENFKTVHLFNKLINICADLPQTALKDIGNLKMLTGGDFIYAEHKGVDGFSFKNKAKLIFSCNQLPLNEAEQSEAFYNRLILLIFPYRIKNENINPNYKIDLLSEVDYIFLWGLEGLQRLIKNKFQFTESEASIKLKSRYKKESDPIQLFLDNNCEFEKLNSEGIEGNELYGYYNEWSKDLGYKAKDNSVFGQAIIRRYGNIKKQKRVNGKRKNIYEGLKYVS